MENKYWERAIEFKEKFKEIIKELIGNKYIFELKLDDVNLLENPENCIESSTAIGFCFEEFITSKLTGHKSSIEFKRISESTQRSSYDLTAIYKDEKYLINIKTEKYKDSQNNAIAATTQLYNDYVYDNPNEIKHFMIAKFRYEISRIKNESGFIKLVKDSDNPFIYFLEEVKILVTTPADKRSWSDTKDKNSGRIQISSSYLKGKWIKISTDSDEKVYSRRDVEDISYENTKNDIKTRYEKLKNK